MSKAAKKQYACARCGKNTLPYSGDCDVVLHSYATAMKCGKAASYICPTCAAEFREWLEPVSA